MERRSWQIIRQAPVITMSANQPSTITWTSDQDSTEPRIDTKSLEIGMTGMSLVSGLQENGPSRKGTGSTISTTPPEDDPNHGTSRTRSSSDPPSPGNSSYKNHNHQGRSHGSRPPGIGAPAPSPIGKPGHSKTTSNVTTVTTSLMSLTPNSSVDGNSEWTSRQPSPPGDTPPSIPFLSSEHRRLSMEQAGDTSTGSMGSYDHHDHDNDGLLGLGALRERAHSTGSGYYSSNSPPVVARGHLPPHEADRRRDRPPLSQSYMDNSSNHRGDGSVGGASTGSAGLQFQQAQAGYEFGDPPGFGAIARPELRLSANEYDPSVRSVGSSENYSHHSSTGVFEQHGQHLPQKFGSLPSLGSHIQQHRVYLAQDLSKPRHMRSVSQPVHNPPSTVQMDHRPYEQQHHRYGMPPQRPAIPTQHQLSSSYDAATVHYSNQKRNSLPNYSTSPTGYGHMHHTLERRDALDFPGGYHGSMSDDVRVLGNPTLVSPGHSPHQLHYGGGHSRQPSDASPSILSSSPMSMGNTMLRSHSVPFTRQSSFPNDDDLHHPLIGENIEVPADHYGETPFLMSSQMPMLRSHSASMGELGGHYGETGSHHLPTAGAALPLPKVVYSVKFKRTQRNFVLGPRITRDLKIGTYVKVEADRGEDLGIVVGKLPADKFNFASRTQYTAGMGPPGGLGGSSAADLKRIIRLATHDEVSLLGIKREEEEELLKICRGKVRQRLLPMNVVDAEYQFDRHKLTFFFEAEGRVDFRELVRDLFSMYKTRIWMQQLDKNTAIASQAMMAPQANLQMDYGTPIIAPASEFASSLNTMGC